MILDDKEDKNDDVIDGQEIDCTGLRQSSI